MGQKFPVATSPNIAFVKFSICFSLICSSPGLFISCNVAASVYWSIANCLQLIPKSDTCNALISKQESASATMLCISEMCVNDRQSLEI